MQSIEARTNNLTYLPLHQPTPHLFWQSPMSVDSLTCTSPAIHTFLPPSFHFYQVGNSRIKQGLCLHYPKTKQYVLLYTFSAHALFIRHHVQRTCTQVTHNPSTEGQIWTRESSCKHWWMFTSDSLGDNFTVALSCLLNIVNCIPLTLTCM